MRYRWILFDADGTLFDYDRAESCALEQVWRDLALPLRSSLLADFRAVNASLWAQYERGEIEQDYLRVERFRRLLPGASVDFEALSSRYLWFLGESGLLFPGVANFLGTLHGRVPMALVTNGIADVQRRRLARAGIEGLFEAVVISSEVGAAKPHAGFFDAAFDALGAAAGRDVLMVGDNLHADVAGGADYGLATCWVNPAGLTRDAGVRVDHEVAAVTQLAPLFSHE